MMTSIGTPVARWIAKALNRDIRRDPRKYIESNEGEITWPVSAFTIASSFIPFVEVRSM